MSNLCWQSEMLWYVIEEDRALFFSSAFPGIYWATMPLPCETIPILGKTIPILVFPKIGIVFHKPYDKKRCHFISATGKV